MSPSQLQQSKTVFSSKLSLLGATLIAINPLLTFAFPPDTEAKVLPFLGIGFLSMAIGFVMISPLIVILVDRFAAPLIARILGIDSKLLASQITSHLWRTASTAISLAIGIGLFIGVQVWGFTMLDGFLVGPWAPDAVVAFDKSGFDLHQLDKFKKIAGVNADQTLPIVVEQPRLKNDITGSAERASVTRQDNIVIVGLDPQKGFAENNPVFNVKWTNGTPAEAITMMKAGRACLVPDHFLVETGLTVGDTFELIPPKGENTSPVIYKIAGAVKLPGWHWQTKLTGFRSRTHRAAAMMFASYDFVAQDFDFPNATHLWFNFDSPAADPAKILSSVKEIVTASNADSAPVDESASNIRIMPVEQIRDMTRRNASRWIWAISQLPIIATMIAGVGVLNVFLASIRSRQWELGVLRSIGFTRSALIRAIIGEGILIGLVASFISLSFGILSGWCGCGIAQHMSFFGGLHPSLHIPWAAVCMSIVFLLSLSTLTSVWPAISFVKLRPLTLLQRGRASF